jgi:hypothetical protein
LAIKTINIEESMPSIAQARARLADELRAARQGGTALVKIIHGYGSSGVGGDLRIALQATLRQLQERGDIRACIFGENWRRGDERSWELIKRFPGLKDDRDLGKGNRGVTIVVL